MVKIIQKIKRALNNSSVKIMTALALSGTPAAALGQQQSSSDSIHAKENFGVLQTVSPEIRFTAKQMEAFKDSCEAEIKSSSEKKHSFAQIDEVPAIISNRLNTEYIMDFDLYCLTGETKLKRARKEQIVYNDVTTIMEHREGPAEDAVNLNKARTRMFICQGNVLCGEDFVRMLYFSKNNELHNFAAKYIGGYRANGKNSPRLQNQAEEKIYEMLYNQDNNFKLGEEGRKDRREAFKLMRCFSIKNMAVGNKFSYTFINDFKKLDRQCHDELLEAEKEYCCGFYNLENPNNIPAQKASAYAKSHHLRDASCVPPSFVAHSCSSGIAAGPYSRSNVTHKEKKQVLTGQKIDKADYVTETYVYHLALSGYSGADELYENFLAAKQKDQEHIQKIVNKFLPQPHVEQPDAIKRQNIPLSDIYQKQKLLTPEQMKIRLTPRNNGR